MKAGARRRAQATRNAIGTEPGTPASVSAALDAAFAPKPATIPGYEGDTHGHVNNTEDFRRVHDLPRRDWHTRTDIDDLVALLTAEYKTPSGSMVLRPIQAVTLEALHDIRGCFGAIGVGEGKTLITYLAPLVLGARRPLLIVPAKLKEKTAREFAALSKDWQSGPAIEIVSYEWLGRVGAADFLDGFDLVAADEVHKIRNPSAAVTRRVVRYLRANPGVAFLALSGTVASRSLMDFHHLLALTVGPEQMPLPQARTECKTWARAVDEKITTRGRPGALKLLLDEGTRPSLQAIREAVGSRIYQTAGVVNTIRKSVDASIVMELRKTEMHPSAEILVDDLINLKIAPNGDEAFPADVARHIRTLACGFYYVWDPAPPEDWLDGRRNWKRLARDILEREDEGLDSELQIANAIRSGAVSYGADILEEWTEVRDTFKPNSVPVWIHDPPVDKPTEPTIVWVEHRAAGRKLSELWGVPYFHRLGLDDAGNFIDDASGVIVASIASNSEGRNLQAWHRNLVITPPANGRTWEQLLGRTHRQGQTADEVSVDVLVGHGMIRRQLRQAFDDARFIEATTRQPQKLLQTDLT